MSHELLSTTIWELEWALFRENEEDGGSRDQSNVKHLTLSNGIAEPHNGALQLATSCHPGINTPLCACPCVTVLEADRGLIEAQRQRPYDARRHTCRTA